MSLDSVLDVLMPWVIGICIIGFVAWLFKTPLKIMFRWLKDVLGYGREQIEGYETIKQIGYE